MHCADVPRHDAAALRDVCCFRKASEGFACVLAGRWRATSRPWAVTMTRPRGWACGTTIM
eukprot:365081-Chlamydomonas_euryale.AAC.6